MSRFLILLSLMLGTWYLVLFSASPVSAQSSSFDSFFQWLTGGLTQTKVPDTLERVNDSSLPFGIREEVSTVPEKDTPPSEPRPTVQNVDVVARTAGEYANGVNAQTPFNTSSTTSAFNILNFIKQLFTDPLSLFQFGNKKAVDYASLSLPEKSRDSLSAQNSYTVAKSESSTDSDVLAAQSDQSRAMLESLQLKQKQSLPFMVGESLQASNDIAITPYETTPPASQAPQTPPSGGGGYGSVGKCKLGYGYCSVAYLKPFFGNDEIKAEKASQVCWAESRGREWVRNIGCFRDPPGCRTQEYSIGLFQISLWFDDRCTGTLKNTVVGKKVGCDSGLTISKCACADTVWNPPFSCEEGPNFASCTEKFKDPTTNIQKAVDMSGGGTNWQPWSTAAKQYCDLL